MPPTPERVVLFPETVLFVTVMVPEFQTPAPSKLAVFPDTVLLTSVNLASSRPFRMPPPIPRPPMQLDEHVALLRETVVSTSVNVPLL
jgi:hypothetical protein